MSYEFIDDDPLSGLDAAPTASVPTASVPTAPPVNAPDPFYLEGLNDAQRAAVESLDGPVLVLAGAGTGKTRALTTRLVHLIATRRAAHWQILCVTFTNKAAREMRERVGALLGNEPEGWWLGTFHALAARMLRRHAEVVGLQSNFTILDADDQQRLIKQLLEAEQVDTKKWPPRLVLSIIERWKDRGLTPDKLSSDDAGGEVAGGKMAQIYRAYQQRLLTVNACDFGDLLLHTLNIFQNHPDILAEYHNKFRYILVDEYQDTNVCQYLWLQILARGHRNICCVGDEDQSIYGWRGAEIGNILRFEKDFPGAAVIRLERNYRSTGNILKAASHLIAHNTSRLGKTLWTESDGGEPVRVQAVWDGGEEARWVSDEIESRQRKQESLREMAVLVRAGHQMRAFEERFIATGIPYRVIGGPRFYERQEIRDALAYLRVVNQPTDDLAFERIVNLPKRGIGDAAMLALRGLAREKEISLNAAGWLLVETTTLKPKPRGALSGLLQDFFRWKGLSATIPHTDLARMVLDESGYTKMWQDDKTPEAPGRLENLKELISSMAEFENLGGFLEHIALVMDNAESTAADQVSVMTLHAAKGLEFNTVFLPGWEEGLFPSQRALDENGMAGLEEERRLAYVGLTRARKQAVVLHAANRQLYGSWVSALPSRFIGELPEHGVEIEAGSGLYGGRQSGGFGESQSSFKSRSDGFGGISGWDPFKQNPGDRQSFQRTPAASASRAAFSTPSSRPAGAGKSIGFAIGDKVRHKSFGAGTVRGVDRDKLEIFFDDAGPKKVMADFVEKV